MQYIHVSSIMIGQSQLKASQNMENLVPNGALAKFSEKACCKATVSEVFAMLGALGVVRFEPPLWPVMGPLGLFGIAFMASR